MRQSIQRCLMVAAILAFMCGSAWAQPAGKDWYGALRLGYQPYTLEVEGTFRGQDFDAEADLSDIMDDYDTTILGGELEFGTGPYFFVIGAFFQETEVEEGSPATDGFFGEFTKTAINPMLGYVVYKDQGLKVDLMAGAFYVKMEVEANRFRGGVLTAIDESIDFTDPMVGARVGFRWTKNWSAGAMGEIGGFGVGSELQYVVAANVGYDFTDWFKLFGGYKYWYFKYEDDGAQLSELEHTLHGPVLGVQFTF